MSVNGPTVHHNFSETYYKRLTQFQTNWLGVPIIKCPLDLWLYQEIIHDTDPDVIVETGTFSGGSALWLAHLCDVRGKGRIVTVDIEKRSGLPEHPRIKYVAGLSSTDPVVRDTIQDSIEPGERVMVILDSDHSAQHVFIELRMYAPLVTKGCYLIVEDTNLHGYTGAHRQNGPAKALKDWQPVNHGFEVDRAVEKFGFSQNPNGFLKRIR